MKHLSNLAATVSLLLLSAALFTPAAQAQSTFHRTTHVTFSGPVEISGKVLPAGKYTFRLNVLPSNETGIVQILNGDGTKTIANLLTIADYRLTPSDKTVITFTERAGNSPNAIRAWFYPGENFGHEFVYPMKRARQLAAANHVNVPAVPDATADNDLKSAHVTEATPSGSEAEVAQEAPPAATQNPPAESAPASSANDNSNNLVASNQPLPKTASDTYSVALLGGLFLFAGLLVGVVRRTAAHENEQ
jgi:hypothetical protein